MNNFHIYEYVMLCGMEWNGMNERVSKLDEGKSVEKEEIELDDESFS